MRHLKLASTLCIGLLTIGRKGGTFVRKSRHKKGNEKSHSDNTESQAKREFKPLVWYFPGLRIKTNCNSKNGAVL